MTRKFNTISPLFACFIYLSLTCACRKNSGIPGTGGTVDTIGTGIHCTATISAAENIMIFPSDNPWNKDISLSATDVNSTSIIGAIGTNPLKADFGSGLWQGAPIGIPYVVVCGNQAKIPIHFTDYGDESDPGPYPIPLSAPLEGNGTGDSHAIAIDIENGKLYELFNAHVNGSQWDASSGAVFDLHSNAMRPETWTSADAAGLPIFPGLVRYEEILKGDIDHPIRFTLTSNHVQPAYVYPARHKVSSTGGPTTGLPFGARIRLKTGFNMSGYSAVNQVILRAMKKYGLILADIGSNMYISGAPDARWNNDDLRLLGQIHGSDFEVVNFH